MRIFAEICTEKMAIQSQNTPDIPRSLSLNELSKEDPPCEEPVPCEGPVLREEPVPCEESLVYEEVLYAEETKRDLTPWDQPLMKPFSVKTFLVRTFLHLAKTFVVRGFPLRRHSS